MGLLFCLSPEGSTDLIAFALTDITSFTSDTVYPITFPTSTTSLSGTILSSDGTPLDVSGDKNMYIYISANDISTQQEVGADGSYSISLVPGTYDLRVVYYYNLSSPQQDGRFQFFMNDFAVTGTQTNNISLPTITVSGTVTDPSGQPVSGALLEISGHADDYVHNSYANAYTAANGAYN